MTVPEKFDIIRPYNDDEVQTELRRLFSDPQFQSIIPTFGEAGSPAGVQALIESCHTPLDFQKHLIYGLLKTHVIAPHTTSLELDDTALTDKAQRHTYISNHRDIVLDSSLLSVLLIEKGYGNTVEIAIGDNLLAFPWIERLVRLCKAFIVRRSLSIREMLAGSQLLSEYMHFAIGEKKESIWIAQREGRAKDSNDRTQESLLKMMAMGGEGTIVERLQQLHLVPMAISYEYDPCDFLKAREFQLRRDNPDFKKTREDDLLSMKTGIFGDKGGVLYKMGPCIDDEIGALEGLPKAEIFARTAALIDRHIFAGYRLFAGNLVARDLLQGTDNGGYTPEERRRFEDYLDSRMALIDLPGKDEAFLRECLLKMYANPAINQAAL